MTKRRGRPRNGSNGRGNGRGRRPNPRQTRIIHQAEDLIEENRPKEAMELLESELEKRPASARLLVTMGYAREAAGDLWGALAASEDAVAHSDDPEVALRLASLYVEVNLLTHALRLLRDLEPSKLPPLLSDGARETMAFLREDLTVYVEKVGLPEEEAEKGLLFFEQGRRALVAGDYAASIEANRQAIQVYRDWSSPRNNLAMALFLDGQPDEALEQVALSLESDPDSIHALGLGARYLMWFGREDEAREMWQRLEKISPRDLDERLQKAEAAAALLEHEAVYRLLRPSARLAAREWAWGSLRAHELLGIAEANTGRRKQAMRRLDYLAPKNALAREAWEGARARRGGIGWTDYYRYFDVLNLLPVHRTDEFLELTRRDVEEDPEKFRRDLRSFTERYPQVIRIAEKTIWEEQMPSAGIDLLWALGTERACEALERFAFSQVGPDGARLEAVSALANLGRVGLGEPARVWLDGEWRNVTISFDAEPEPAERPTYSDEVADLLNQGRDLLQDGNPNRAEELFLRALELEPKAREAYNNLAIIYTDREDEERAERLLEKAVEIDPLYVHAACNLANRRINQGRVEEAEELLGPLSTVRDMSPEGARFYDYTRALILIKKRAFSAAVELLEGTLNRWPDYEAARETLKRVSTMATLESAVDQMTKRMRINIERQRKRDSAWRKELQKELTTLTPTLERALSLYYKDALQAMAEIWMPEGGWSKLRKAELVDDIIYAIIEEDKVGSMVAGLAGEDLDALEAVVERGGVMAWDAFDEQFGNDLDESRRWRDHTPESTMGQLRLHGLLVEATVDDQLYVVIPSDIRETVSKLVGSISPD